MTSPVKKVDSNYSASSMKRLHEARMLTGGAAPVNASSASSQVGSQTDNPFSHQLYYGDLTYYKSLGEDEKTPKETLTPPIEVSPVVVPEVNITFKSEEIRNIGRYESNMEAGTDNSNIEGDA